MTPIALAMEASGTVVVADGDAFAGKGGVVRVDATAGGQTAVSQGAQYSGPRGVTVVPPPGR